MSVIPPKAEIDRRFSHVGSGPKGDVLACFTLPNRSQIPRDISSEEKLKFFDAQGWANSAGFG